MKEKDAVLERPTARAGRPGRKAALCALALGLALGIAALRGAIAPERAYAAGAYVSRVDALQADPGNLNPSGTPAHSSYMEITAGGASRMAVCAEHEGRL